jgi:hypothetical protein
VAVVVEPLRGGVLDRAVHSLDLTVCPRVLHLGHPVLDPMFPADALEDVLHREDVALAVGELDAPRRRARTDGAATARSVGTVWSR